MSEDRIARTVEDVRRLAPVEGYYWTRPSPAFEWAMYRLAPADGDLRAWWQPGYEKFLADALFVGFEIIGPIPEPGT